MLLQILFFCNLIGFIKTAKVEYGMPCSEKCDVFEYTCINHICECKKLAQLNYYKNGKSTCLLDVQFASSCTDDQIFNDVYFVCDCKDGFVKNAEDKLCYEAVYQKPMNDCYIKEKAYICDPKLHLYCDYGKCICFKFDGTSYDSTMDIHCEEICLYNDFDLFRGMYYNDTEEECVSKPEGAKSYVGEPCDVKSECVEGLECKNSKCQCSHGCNYVEDMGACDCGNIRYSSATSGVIITGISLGILSILFWCYVIKKTYKSGKERVSGRNTDGAAPERYPMSDSTDEFTSGERRDEVFTNKSAFVHDNPPPYDEAIATGQTQIGFVAPSAPQIPSDNRLPYTISPVQSVNHTPYPINPTSPILSGKTDQSDNPPPYPLNPGQIVTSPLTHST